MAYALKGLGFTCLVAAVMGGMGAPLPAARAQEVPADPAPSPDTGTDAGTGTDTDPHTDTDTDTDTDAGTDTDTDTGTDTDADTDTGTDTDASGPEIVLAPGEIDADEPAAGSSRVEIDPFAACSRGACAVRRRPRSVDTASFTSTW